MNIGYACIPMGVNYKTTRGFVIKNFSKERLCQCVLENLKDLKRILQYNIRNGIYFFRISSDIIPFGSHKINNIRWWEIFKDELFEIGEYINAKSIRVSMHPGQYTVLNSTSQEVVENSIRDVEYHTKFLDCLNIDYTHKVVIHVGGVYGDKNLSMKRFVDNFKKLSPSAKARLILENDDKAYNIQDVLGICNKIGIPAVFDNLHHFLNPCEWNIDYIFKQVKDTWKEKDGHIKVHYSDKDLDKKRGAHSKFVLTQNFLDYYEKVAKYEPDIMLEVKDKDISAIKCVNLVFNEGKKSVLYDQWAKYKYLVMEKGYSLYKTCSKMVGQNCSLKDFYIFIDKCLCMPYNEKNFKNTALHVWGYFKDCATEKEKKDFLKLIDEFNNPVKVKSKLERLAIKYQKEYLINSYYLK